MLKFTSLLLSLRPDPSGRETRKRSEYRVLWLPAAGCCLCLLGVEPALNLGGVHLLANQLPLVLRRERDRLLSGELRLACLPCLGGISRQRQVCLGAGSRVRDDLRGPGRIGRLVEPAPAVGLEHQTGQRVARLLAHGDVALPCGARLRELLLALGAELAGVGVGVVCGELVVRTDQIGEGGLVLRIQLERREVLLDPCVDGRVDRAAAVRVLTGDRVEEPAGDVAGSDAEQDQTATHEDGENQVDDLNQPSALALEIEDHGRIRNLPPMPTARRPRSRGGRRPARAGYSARRAG